MATGSVTAQTATASPSTTRSATAVQVGSSPSASTPQIPLPITAPTTWGSTAALRRLRKRPCISSPIEDTMARDQLQSVAQIREIMKGETAQAVEAMLLLRPRWKTADAVIDLIDTKLRPTGYRLLGAFEHSPAAAVSINGVLELVLTDSWPY